MLAFSFGPWLSLFLFHRLGNQWRVDDCRAVLLSGVALMAAPLALMCFFDDDRAVQHRGAAHPGQQQGTRQGTEQQEPCCGDGGSGEGDSSEPQAAAAAAPGAAPAAGGGGGPGVAAATAADPAAGDAVGWLEEGEAEDAPPPCCGLPAAVAVTLLITASDLIGALASG